MTRTFYSPSTIVIFVCPTFLYESYSMILSIKHVPLSHWLEYKKRELDLDRLKKIIMTIPRFNVICCLWKKPAYYQPDGVNLDYIQER